MKEWFTSYFIYFSKTHFRCSNPLITKRYDASDKVKQTSYQHHKKGIYCSNFLILCIFSLQTFRLSICFTIFAPQF